MIFSKKNKQELLLILEVQSSLVRGTLVVREAASLPRISFVAQADVVHRPHLKSPYLIKATVRALNEVVEQALRFLQSSSAQAGIPSRISAIHFILSSPWIISSAKAVSASYERPRQITHASMMKMVEEGRPELLDASAMRLVEEKIFAVHLNGYPVSEWEGKSATDITVSYAASAASTSIIDAFKDTCRHTSASRIVFHSALLLEHAAIQALMPESSSYIIVHAHGEVTDVAAVRDHACSFFGSYPIGLLSIIRKSSKSLHTDTSTAASFITSAATHALDVAHGGKAEAVIRHIFEGWVHGLVDMLKGADGSIPTQAPLILFALAHEPMFKETLATHFPGRSISMIDPDVIASRVTVDAHVRHEPMSALFAVAIHTE